MAFCYRPEVRAVDDELHDTRDRNTLNAQPKDGGKNGFSPLGLYGRRQPPVGACCAANAVFGNSVSYCDPGGTGQRRAEPLLPGNPRVRNKPVIV